MPTLETVARTLLAIKPFGKITTEELYRSYQEFDISPVELVTELKRLNQE